MKTREYLEFLPIIAIGLCLFVSYPVAAALLMLSLFASVIFFHNKLRFQGKDILLFTYFIIATVVYMTLSNQLTNYAEIVFFPILSYLSVSAIKTDGIKALKLLLVFVIAYSIATVFRDVNGNFTLNIAENVFMYQRVVDEAAMETSNPFFRNATLVAIWPVTACILSLSLYNFSKKRIYLAVLLASFLMVFVTNTRTALGCVILILLINSIRYKQKVLLRIIIFAVPILVLLVLSLGNLYQGQVERYNDLTQGNSSYGLGDRMYFWSYTMNLIQQNIWGYGHDFVHSHIGYSTHNEYLGQAVSVGLLAAFLYYAFILISALKRYTVFKKSSNVAIWNEIALYLLIVYFINGLTEQISAGNRVWVALLFMAIGWSQIEVVKRYVSVNFFNEPAYDLYAETTQDRITSGDDELEEEQ